MASAGEGWFGRWEIGMEFDSEWVTLGNHRVRLRGVRGFPTEKMRCMAEVAKIAVESNLSAAARLLDITSEGGKAYTISIGTTFAKDRDAAPHLEVAVATVFGIKLWGIISSLSGFMSIVAGLMTPDSKPAA